MKRRVLTTILAIAIAGPAIADKAIESAIKARQGQMQIYQHNLGILGAMAKGTVDYDAAAAAAAANNIKAAASLDAMSMWPQGSDMDSVEGTRAKAEIWTTFPAIAENGMAMSNAADVMAAAAGTDLTALQGAMGALGGACSSCHKAYRGRR
ncbi:c-type cytochrome [Cognatishimia activa]|uniref:High-potential cytochrome c n=1 Tax=Cognatishimia activa TaxID=1715691 RepID=A0A0P1ITY7_9RHOB|nr:cytochrome c [Cognatishimia activa]CUJ24747.1 High-potential cytochrome c [Cognatishimia activa]CUK25351.1 High-potential cytochrome c [Cognatishimia activa]